MKKTEKIEIRVSLEEKAVLTQLAEFEGQSVSQLVRSLVKRYAAINTSRSRSPRIIGYALGGMCAAYILGFALYSTGFVKADAQAYMVEGSINDDAFGFAIDLAETRQQTWPLGSTDDKLTVIVKAEDASSGEPRLAINICKAVTETCTEIAGATLELGAAYPSVWQTSGTGGEAIFISVQRLAG